MILPNSVCMEILYGCYNPTNANCRAKINGFCISLIIMAGNAIFTAVRIANMATPSRDNDNRNDNRRSLIIECGDHNRDRNASSDGDPIGHKDSGHDWYAQLKNNKIEDNIYENCKGVCVVWGFRFGNNRSFKPKDNEFKKNKLKAGSERSVLLEFKNSGGGDGNKFKDNEMDGSAADRGDLLRSGLED